MILSRHPHLFLFIQQEFAMLDNQPLDKLQALQLAATLLGSQTAHDDDTEAVQRMFAIAKLIREQDRHLIHERMGSIKPVNLPE